LCASQSSFSLSNKSSIFESLYSSKFIFRDLRAILSSWEGVNLPEELYTAVQDYIYEYASDIAFLFAIGRGNNVCTFDDSPSLFGARSQTAIAPAPILTYFLTNLSSNLSTLKLHHAFLNDVSFSILAESSAAKNLRCLDLERLEITDRSAHLWKNFESLEDLHLLTVMWVSRKTLESISKLQRLRNIELLGNWTCKMDDFFVFFGPDSVPSLQTFHLTMAVASDDSTIPRLIQLLRLRPNRERLTSVVLGLFSYRAEYAELFQLCPNLRRSSFFFTSLDDIESSGASPSITYLDLQHLVHTLDDVEMSRFVQLCPNLEELFLAYGQISLEHESFKSFRNLRTLDLNGVSGITTITSYPSTLSNVAFKECKIAGALPVNQLTSFMLANLIRDAPGLEKFFSLSTFPLDKTHLEMLYGGLRSAETISFFFDTISATEVTAFHYPASSLAWHSFDLSQPGKGYIPEIGYLPALKKLCINPLVRNSEEKPDLRITLSHEALPNLRYLILGFYQYEVDISDVEAEYDNICSLAPSLGHLTLLGEWSSFLSGQLSRLHRLQSLLIERTSNFSFTPAMQNLLYLEISRSLSSSWVDPGLRFPYLQRLNLDTADIKQNITITAEQFPSLQHLEVKYLAKIGLEIRNHPKLFSISLSSMHSFTHIDIIGCTNLYSMTMNYSVGGFRTVIDENPNLRRLNLLKCETFSHPETRIQISPMDVVRFVTNEKDSDKLQVLYKAIVDASKDTLVSGMCTTYLNNGMVDTLIDPPKL
jgi:hypothetical protein